MWQSEVAGAVVRGFDQVRAVIVMATFSFVLACTQRGARLLGRAQRRSKVVHFGVVLLSGRGFLRPAASGGLGVWGSRFLLRS